MTFLVAMFAIFGVGYFIAFTRKGTVAGARLGSRQQEVRSPASPDQVFERIAGIAAPYSVDDKAPTSKILVLSSPVTFASWGFLYPVFIHADGAGSRIQIGCQSKFVQMGPLVTSAHGKCVAAIEQVLSIPAARVAS